MRFIGGLIDMSVSVQLSKQGYFWCIWKASQKGFLKSVVRVL